MAGDAPECKHGAATRGSHEPVRPERVNAWPDWRGKLQERREARRAASASAPRDEQRADALWGELDPVAADRERCATVEELVQDGVAFGVAEQAERGP